MAGLTGRTALVTGASRGLGLAIAGQLWSQGANVAMVGRTPEIHETMAKVKHFYDNQRLTTWELDVTNADEWDEFIRDYERVTSTSFDIAVCNAGIYGPIGRADDVNWDEWIDAVNVNLFGTVLTCRAVLPSMRLRGYGKIICVSGGGATRPLPRFSAYAASKAAVVRFAETLAVELKGSGIDVNSIAPGALNTRMLDQVLDAGPEKAGRAFYAKALEQKQEGGTPLATPAKLVAFLASPDCDGISGRLISAVWDNWPELPKEGLHKNLDRYTLRRIP